MPAGERRTYSGESPQERVAAALQTLEQGIDSILTSESFAAYLRTMSRLHNYSFGNALLIHAQRPDASMVAGYQRWKELGRQVKKGEKGIKILVPHKSKIKPENDEDEATVVLRGFGIGNVWDLSQTEGDPVPQPPEPELIDGASDVGMRLYVDLIDYLDMRGIPVCRETTLPSNGFFEPRTGRIGIGFHIDGDHATKTLTHEAAHAVAGHTLGMNSRDVETVAESAAYVVLNHYGIDSSGYTFPYVSSWARDKAVFKQNLEAIQQVSHQIIGGIEGDELRTRRGQTPGLIEVTMPLCHGSEGHF